MTVTPAYGRDYKSGKAAKADWDAGKDFIVADYHDPDDGRYVNRGSLPKGTKIGIRFNRLTKQVLHTNPGDPR